VPFAVCKVTKKERDRQETRTDNASVRAGEGKNRFETVWLLPNVHKCLILELITLKYENIIRKVWFIRL